ncbi:MAG TPA: glycine oxidase ThiO [Pyrinomonadaceae bacterium]|nr:glycine oxidase ThiO [Pyrinomonadaceae bacterium]
MLTRNIFNAESADVIIIGGGVIGLAIARELAQRGVRNVTLVERGELGAEASWAAAGILAPQVEADRPDDFFRLACASRDLYPDFAAALLSETGIDVELDQTGTLYSGFTTSDEGEMRARFDWQVNAGLAVEWLSGDEARLLEPNLSSHVRCALRFPNDYQVENRKLVKALTVSNQRLGVQLENNCEVRTLKFEKEKITGVETSTGLLSASVVIVAAGAWTSQIPTVSVPIDPVRGQMLCFNAPQFARHVIYSSRGYLVPRRDGRLLAGSTSERAGFDRRVTEEGVQSIQSMAFEIAPRLEDLILTDLWAGFRPHAEDSLPVIGPDEEVAGLFYATGHYRNGILLAPITARIMAESVVDGRLSLLTEKFSPSRFSRVSV